jgi:hypothetical protein
MTSGKRRTRRRPKASQSASERVHTVKAALNVHRLSKAGSSLTLQIFAHEEKIGEIELGRGSLFWRGGKRKSRKKIGWTQFAEMMDRLAYGD